MRTTSGIALLLALSAAPPSEPIEIVFAPEKGARVEKQFVQRLETELGEQTLSANGEELSDGESVEIENVVTDERVFVDEYVELADGRPKVLVREFERLHGSVTTQMRGQGWEHEEEGESESVLEGRKVRFAWDDEQEEYVPAFEGEGEEAGEADDLAGLVADVDLLGFLPGKAVEEGDTWDVEPAHFGAIMAPGGDVLLVDPEEDEESVESERKMERELTQNLGGELEATFRGLREEEGRRVAVIELEGKLRAKADDEYDDEDGDPVQLEIEMSLEVDGRILWDLEAGRPHSCSFEGPVNVSYVESTSWEDDEEGNMSYVVRMSFTGTIAYTGSWKSAD